MAGAVTHKADKRAKYKATWGGLDHVHQYGIDVEKREIYLFGRDEYVVGIGAEEMSEPGIEYTLANQFIKNLRILQSASPDPILIHMKTCGGDFGEGMAIYQAIKSCPNLVTILNYTHARSMSSVIFLAADRRVMMPYSVFMIHRGTWGFDGTVTQAGTEFDQLKLADKYMMDIYLGFLKESKEFAGWNTKRIRGWLTSRMQRREEVYFTAEEAVKYNLADYIFGVDGKYDWNMLRATS